MPIVKFSGLTNVWGNLVTIKNIPLAAVANSRVSDTALAPSRACLGNVDI